MNEFSPTNMLRADNNPKFYARFKWLGLGAIAFMGWFLYDGSVTYPPQRDHSQALINVAQETFSEAETLEIGPAGHEKQEWFERIREIAAKNDEVVSQWKSLAEENGWPTELPETYRDENDIFMQYVMAIPCAIAAVWLLLTVYFANGRWVELRDGSILTSWGQTFPLSSITQINKKQWRDKGIARVKYEHEGRKGSFTVDNYKFMRNETDQILREMELVAGHDKIVGGPPEKKQPEEDKSPQDDGDETMHSAADQTILEASD